MKRVLYIVPALVLSILAVSCQTLRASASAGRFQAVELLERFRTENVPNSGILVEAGAAGGLGIMSGPSGIWLEEEFILMADNRNRVIWKVDAAGSSIYAGRITDADLWGRPVGGYSDGPAGQALFGSPGSIVPFLGGYAVADSKNNAVRLIKDGVVKTIVGNGQAGYSDGNTTTLSVKLNAPTGLAVDGMGHLYIADTGNNAIRRLDESGRVVTIATGLNEPSGLSYANGTLYIADSGNDRICALEAAAGALGGLTVLSGGIQETEEGAVCLDGLQEAARFCNPQGILAAPDGAVYVADTGNSAVRVIKNGTVATLLKLDSQGMGMYPVSPVGLALDENVLYITDNFTGAVLSLPLQ